jgi:hypothetical protein
LTDARAGTGAAARRPGVLTVHLSDTPLRAEYERCARRLLARGDEAPERRDDERFDGSGYHASAIELAAQNWRRRMKQEHQSAAVFAGMLPQLMEAGAPIDFQVAVLRSAMDELRHARLCGEVVEYLGLSATLDTDLAPPDLAAHSGVPPLERAMRNLMFVGCLSETVAVALLTEEREYVDDPFVDRVMKQLVGDETLHARVGWITLRHTWDQLDEAGRERTQSYLEVALAYYERCMVDATPVRVIPGPVLADARRLGFAHSAAARDLFVEAIETVVLPQLDAIGLDAAGAWARRHCTADDHAGSLTLTG